MIGKKLQHLKIIMAVMMLMLMIQMPVFAEEGSVIIDVDTSLQLGVSTQVTLTLVNIDGQAEIVSFDGLDAFDILGTSQSSSTSIINGKKTKELTLTYTVMPKSLGEFNLQATIRSDNTMYESNQLVVSVSERDESLKDVSQDVFVTTTISNDRTYIGMPVVLTYELYAKQYIDQFGFTEPISVNSMLIEEKNPVDYKPEYVIIDGEQYEKYVVKELLLTPTDVGIVEVPEETLQVSLSSGSFFEPSETFYVSTDKKELTVESLPDVGKPADFTGLVGDFQVESMLSGQTVDFGEPITLNIKLWGEGYLGLVDSIADFTEFEDFTVYETTEGLEETLDETGYKTSQEFEVILVPKTDGDITIEPIKINYFNVNTGTYENLVIEGNEIHVNKAAGTLLQEEVISSPITINQVSYNLPNQDQITIVLSKSMLVFGICGILLLIALIVIYKLLKGRKPTRNYMKEAKKIENSEQLKNLYKRFIREQYHRDIQSSTIEALVRITGSEEEIKTIAHFLEHDIYYNSSDIAKPKEAMMSLIKGLEEA